MSIDSDHYGVATVPCGSCPYRRDVPSGIWAPHEYDKLVAYDRPTGIQPQSLFMCHQEDGNLCAGWLACHQARRGYELLAVRLAAFYGTVDASCLDYTTKVPLFASAAEAREHGRREIAAPGPEAQRMMDGLVRKRGARNGQ